MDNGKIVWGPDPEHGFVLGTIIDIGQSTITVQPKSSGAKVCNLWCWVCLDHNSAV